MRKFLPRGAWLPALVLALTAPLTARADVGPDIRIALVPQSDALPVAGQPFAFTMQVTSATSATATAPDLTTGRTPAGVPAWQELSFPAPTGFSLPALEPVSFPVELLCNDPAQPIEISLKVGGRTTRQRFYLLPQGLNAAIGGNETMMTFDSDKRPAVAPDDSHARPEPAETSPRAVRDRRQPARAESKSATGRNIRVRGRFVYFRESHDEDYNYMGDGRTMGADGVTVSVYDSDWEWDDLLARGVLGPDGYYDFTFWYDDSEAPDIYVEFRAANSKVDLVHPSIWNTTYVWNTPEKEDFGGTEINWGQRHPSSEDHYAGLNLLASGTRAWRWVNDYGYGGIDDVLISWPDADWPHYKPAWETIYMPEFKQWYEDTVCHEYGHHWQQDFTETDGSDYCNPGGRCDDTDDCHHCRWCQESGGDALQEGLPNWMSQHMTSTWPSLYGFSSIFTRDFESVGRCTDGGLDQFDDADLTEGMISAFLQDLTDSSNEEDPNGLNGGADVVTWSPQRILQAQGIDDPITPGGLITSLRNRHPESESAIWQAAANCRFDNVDQVIPSAVTGLTSTSHLTTGDSPDGTVDLVWNPASDNYSGVSGYSVQYGTSGPQLPNLTEETTTNSWTTPDLSPGTYWFTVRAVDNAGNGGSYATFGPVVIRDWVAADVEASTGSGSWPYPVVPRLSNDATTSSAPLPSVLVGNGNTYFNLRIANTGELTTSPTLRLNVYVDGALSWYTSIFALEGFVGRAFMNLGPWEVRGGRHAVRMWADAFEQMPEANEADNFYTRQFIWYPYTLASSGAWATRQRPSDAWGGFTPGLFSAPNCDGFTFGMGTDSFVGAVMVADDDNSDFDLRLYNHTTSPTAGFGYFDVVSISNRPAGCVEGVFVNNAQTTTTTFDAGVVNLDFDGYGFKIRKIVSASMAANADVSFPLSPIEPLALRHFNLSGSSGTNYGQVTLQVDPAVGPVRMKVLRYDDLHAGLDETANQAITDDAGFAKVVFTYGGSLQGLAVWQDPQDVPAGGSGHFLATVRASLTPVDLKPLVTAGWHAPLVPTSGAPGTVAATPLPGTLNGNLADTYINVQFRNDGMSTAGPFDSMTYLDGVPLLGEQLGGLAGQTDRVRNFPSARTVRGGRHTLSMLPDSGGTVGEADEANNHLGLQYVWSPLALVNHTGVDRAAPPDPTGGFAALMAWSSSPAWFNCDGLRTPMPAPAGDNGHWLAVATMPGAASDVDLRLHERINSTLQGFTSALAVSGWGPAASDYVLVNFRATVPRQFDVGALGPAGVEDYHLQTVSSAWLGNAPAGEHGPYTLAGDAVVALHEMWLPAGALTVTLHPFGGDALDWGLTLHRGQFPYHAKSGSGAEAQSWAAPTGADEVMPVEVPQAGYYCLAVWKAGAADLPGTGQYRLRFDSYLSDTPDAGLVPAVTAVREVSPNPFNPTTRIAFELATPDRAVLEVYDVRGRLVRRLVDAALPAGRHEAVWDGHDASGSAAPSGTYVARLRAGSGASSRKMQLLK